MELLTVNQAAEMLGVSPRAVLYRIQRGKLRAQKLGDGRTSAYVLSRRAVEKAARKAEAAA